MSVIRAEEYEEEMIELAGWPARISTYRIGERWSAKVDNVSPGAIVARGEGLSRASAKDDALARARKRFELTRRVEVLEERIDALSAQLADLHRRG